MSTKRRRRHSPEQIVRKLRSCGRDVEYGKDLSAILQSLEVSESTLERWRKQYGGMKSEEAVRLKKLKEENKRLKELVAEKELDIKLTKRTSTIENRLSTRPPANDFQILTSTELGARYGFYTR
jgi:putative transposase